MARVVVTAPADADTADILNDLVRTAGPGIADKYITRFESLYDRLASYPDSGAKRPRLGRDIRIFAVLPYIVIYRHARDDDVVSIIRIVHGRRDITRKLVPGMR